jgi:hypothetical protein
VAEFGNFIYSYCGCKVPEIQVFQKIELSEKFTDKDIFKIDVAEKQIALICSSCSRYNFVGNRMYQILDYVGL